MIEPGLARQRTRLAWRRTVLNGGVVAILAARLAVHGGVDAVRVIFAAAALAAWSVLVGIALARMRTAISVATAPPTRALPLLALLTVGYAVLGGVLVTTV